MTGELVPKGEDQSPEWLKQFVANSAKELELRAQELALREKQDGYNFDYAKKTLDAQERDRKHERECTRKSRVDFYYLIFGVVLLVALLLGILAWIGRGDIALEIIKALFFLISGGAGGYGIGRSRSKQSEVNINSEQG
jgi:hypothetical protein